MTTSRGAAGFTTVTWTEMARAPTGIPYRTRQRYSPHPAEEPGLKPD
jgi:hypothetical protein